MENKDRKYIEEKSKTLAFLLRHDKTYAFLEHGYRDVNDLVANHGFTKEELCEIVATDDKGRYEFFDEQQLLVRARYGHSVNVDVELLEAVPPSVLYHGTAKRFVESIQQQGILKMSRLYVHLSATVEEAIKVGKRHGEPVVLEIDARRMSEDGIKFFRSRNGVWMTKFVDAKYSTNWKRIMQRNSTKHQLFLIAFTMLLAAVLSGCGSGKHVSADNSTKYYYAFDNSDRAYARELTRFAENLLHDEATFQADLSKKLGKLRITLQISPDGNLKVYSWHDGDEGSAMNYHSIYQTYSDGRFRAVFMEDYYYEPRAVYQVESPEGPVYLIQYFSRESGWTYAIGVDAFTIDQDGGLVPAEVFECIPELHENVSGYAARLAVECSPVPPSLYQEGAWADNLFFTITGKDFYMPHYVKNKEPNEEDVMTDFYHRFEWDGQKFRYKQLVSNPMLAKNGFSSPHPLASPRFRLARAYKAFLLMRVPR